MTGRALLKVAFCVLGLVLLSLPLCGQSTEAEIKAQLKDKPLYLRGFWRGSDLNFDAEGKLLGTSEPTTFTLAGFDFDSVRLKKDKLILDGTRMGTEFRKGVPHRVSLGNMRVRIALPSNSDFGPALHAIFVDGLLALVPSLPEYWQDFGSCLRIASVAPEHANMAADCTRRSDRDVRTRNSVLSTDISPPRVLKKVAARFTEESKQQQWSGKTLIGLVVSEKGTPGHLTVLGPLGLGLDEEALLAAAQFQFEPAKQHGKPVRIEINIEVNFAIY